MNTHSHNNPRMRASHKAGSATVVVRSLPAGFPVEHVERAARWHGEVRLVEAREVRHKSGRVEGFVEVQYREEGTAGRAAEQLNGTALVELLPAPTLPPTLEKATPSQPRHVVPLQPHPNLAKPQQSNAVSLADIMAEESAAAKGSAVVTHTLPAPKPKGWAKVATQRAKVAAQRPQPTGTWSLGQCLFPEAKVAEAQEGRRGRKGRRGSTNENHKAAGTKKAPKKTEMPAPMLVSENAFDALARTDSAEAA